MSNHHNMTPDFSDAVEFDNAQVPPGIYNVRVDSWQPKTSQKGDPYISWKLVIFGAEDDLAKQNNRPLYMITMLKGPGAGVLKQFLKAALGEVPGAFDSGWQNQMVGREVQIKAQKNIKPDGTEGFPNVSVLKGL